METETKPQEQSAQTRVLAAYRDRKESGMPTTGLMVLVGNPKSGKTTLAASFPDSYVIELEKGGADRVSGTIDDVTSIAEFRESLKLAVKEPKIKTIVIDTIDQLSDWLEDEIAKQFGLDSIAERKTGVDGRQVWGEYRARLSALLGYLEASNKLIILNAHCKDPKLDEQNNIIIPAGINLPGKNSGVLAGRAKLIGYCYKKETGTGNTYFLSFKGGPLGTWGSRVDELNDKVLQLPRENPYSAIDNVFKPLSKSVPAKGGK